MNDLMIQNIAYTVGNMKETMSSLEIAKVTGKRHADVLRDIRTFFEELGEDTERNFAFSYKDSTGRELPCYNLPKRECLGLASGYDVKLRMAIIDRWAELEYNMQTTQGLTPRLQAISEWKAETDMINDVLGKLGYSQGYLRKESLEIGFRIEGTTGEKFLPATLANDPQAQDPQQLSEHTGTHAALVPMGSQGSTASHIASFFGDVTCTDINTILVKLGYQKRIDNGKYVPTEMGKRLCNQGTLASGPFEGTSIIKEWLYSSNKSLRDAVTEAVQKLKAERLKKKGGRA